jgi:hypothetical protein
VSSGSEQPDVVPDAASRGGLVQRVVRWLRTGYPDQVPPQDFVALLAILRRNLTPSERDQVVDQLAREAAGGHAILTPDLVRDRISEVLSGAVHDEDVARVSARLASVGWPLGPPLGDEDQGDDRPGLIVRVVDWLRADYATGVPERDLFPLLALLRRRLTDDEVRTVASRLVQDGVVPADRVDIGTAIAQVTDELPSEVDIARVQRFLREHGWPPGFTE